MARLGRSQPIPVRIGGRRIYHQASVDLGAFTLGWEFPALTVTSPSVTIPLSVFTLSWEFPSVTPSIGLGVFTLNWSFPSLAVDVPINPGDDLTGPGQLSLNGFRMGSGTPYRLVGELIGADIDMPGVDNGNVANPSSHGAMSGRKLAQPRIITANFLVKAPRDQIQEVMEDFRDNTPIADADEELWLAIQVLDTIYVTRGAVTRRSAPINQQYRLGRAKAVLQVECSDPRLYARQLSSVEVPDGAAVEVFHAGNTTTKPLLRCAGPATNPRLQITRTLTDGRQDARVVEFNLTLEAGEQLIIDVANETATIDDVSQMRHLTGASIGVVDFVLGRGASQISYTTSDGDAPNAVVLWRQAWI
ncbi:hypothetical protein ACFSKW_54625 [Nonomuraea mangrovi]|uniref:Phage tail protein n=1 Tax=Nonomuraea mangrovi TaxID=2316207 RepID=A0ABW4TGW8_9ACTN